MLPAVHAGEDNTIRLALIGCGGRGSGAVGDALSVPDGGPVFRGGLSDAGLSLSGSVKPGTSLTLAYAWPLWTRYLEQKAVDELNHANLYFSLNQAF